MASRSVSPCLACLASSFPFFSIPRVVLRLSPPQSSTSDTHHTLSTLQINTQTDTLPRHTDSAPPPCTSATRAARSSKATTPAALALALAAPTTRSRTQGTGIAMRRVGGMARLMEAVGGRMGWVRMRRGVGWGLDLRRRIGSESFAFFSCFSLLSGRARAGGWGGLGMGLGLGLG